VAAIVGAVLLFVFWLIVTVLRALTRLILGPGLSEPRVLPPIAASPTRTCPRDSCRAMNPASAHFCRRCGQRLEDPRRVTVRRAAML
jgi:hypothetical protein